MRSISGKPLPPSRFRRPLDFERVAGERRQIEIGLECPGVDDLAAFLLDRRKRDEFAGIGGGREIRLLDEFTLRRGREDRRRARRGPWGSSTRHHPFSPRTDRPDAQAALRAARAAKRQKPGADVAFAAHVRKFSSDFALRNPQAAPAGIQNRDWATRSWLRSLVRRIRASHGKSAALYRRSC